MLEEVNDDVGYFVYGIRVMKQPGGIDYQDHYLNKGVPVEIVIMQIKAFLNSLEKEYLDKYGRKPKNVE